LQPNEFTLDVKDNKILQNLCGPMDEHLNQIANHFDVRILRHDNHFQVKGHNFMSAINSIKYFYTLAKTHNLDTENIQNGLASGSHEFLENANAISLSVSGKNNVIKGRTKNQEEYIDAILNHDITFGIGPSGTGKTYLSVACAVSMFERDEIRRIVLVRPAVEAGEKLGFLPGDLTQKVDPYLRPLYDALYSLMGVEKVSRLLEKNTIEIAPLAFMRGRTLNNSFIILDEAQNTTPEQMKMFLTRLGFGSKVVITGDITQIDLAKGQDSGLVMVEKILNEISGIYFHYFDKTDIVRHPLVQKIVEAYEKFS
jgi:phosphate starvation-inducible protein PhoH and related proteins